MNRSCVLCGKNVFKPFYRKEWEIVEIGRHPISFGVCANCGMVMQFETVPKKLMNAYYEQCAVYGDYNAGKYHVTERKKRDLDRLISRLNYFIPQKTQNAFQAGCSDGYTLMRLRDNGIHQVHGVDPSQNGNKIARMEFGIETEISYIENYSFNIEYELMILTHVLEHFYDPKDVLTKICNSQPNGGWIFAEVPLLENIHALPVGYFTFEHINYFTEASFVSMMTQCGYEIICVEKIYKKEHSNNIPVISVIAKKNSSDVKKNTITDSPDILDALKMHVSDEQLVWNQFESNILTNINQNWPVIVWGAGIFAAQLFSNTNIVSKIEISKLVDSSPTKLNRILGNHICESPEVLEEIDHANIIIASLASYDNIRDHIMSSYTNKNFIVVTPNLSEGLST